jgi:hypothetical protein
LKENLELRKLKELCLNSILAMPNGSQKQKIMAGSQKENLPSKHRSV